MVRIPGGISTLLQDLTAALPTVLGENLVGLYLYGSLTQGAFNPEHSDVDCIVVTQHELTDLEFTQLDAWLARASAEALDADVGKRAISIDLASIARFIDFADAQLRARP